MTGTPLEVGNGEKEPHCGSLPQATAQFTPAFLGSLVTVAAIPQESLTIIEVGGGKLLVKVTVIGIVEEFWLPQAARKTQIARKASAWAVVSVQ